MVSNVGADVDNQAFWREVQGGHNVEEIALIKASVAGHNTKNIFMLNSGQHKMLLTDVE